MLCQNTMKLFESTKTTLSKVSVGCKGKCTVGLLPFITLILHLCILLVFVLFLFCQFSYIFLFDFTFSVCVLFVYFNCFISSHSRKIEDSLFELVLWKKLFTKSTFACWNIFFRFLNFHLSQPLFHVSCWMVVSALSPLSLCLHFVHSLWGKLSCVTEVGREGQFVQNKIFCCIFLELL